MKFGRPDYDDLGVIGLDSHIPKEEPVFLLRAQDLLAANVVVYLAAWYRQELGKTHPLTKLAEQQAEKMNEWRKANRPGRNPDLPKDLMIKLKTKIKNNEQSKENKESKEA